jgi:response regulator RpfG family c-di-GMP phosphodiesterase
LPFPIPQLELDVNKKLDQIRKNPKLNQLFSKLKIDRSAGNLSAVRLGLLINIATGISTKLEWHTDKTLEKFIYAAYLHDMALANNQEFINISTSEKLTNMKSKLTEVEIKQILEHPNIAADMIEDYKEISADVVCIVRQHHECPDGSGFPGKITYQKITPLATVFIVAHDLTEYIMNNADWTLEKYLQNVKHKFKGVHFNKILSTIRIT